MQTHEGVLEDLSRLMGAEMALDSEGRLSIVSVKGRHSPLSDPLKPAEVPVYVRGFEAGVRNHTLVRKVCRFPGCKSVAGRGAYCSAHKEEAKAQFEEMVAQQKAERELRAKRYALWHEKARKAGAAAFKDVELAPQDRGLEGLCYVVVAPGNYGFPRWCSDNEEVDCEHLRPLGLGSGFRFLPPDGPYRRREAWCRAFADSLRGDFEKSPKGDSSDRLRVRVVAQLT